MATERQGPGPAPQDEGTPRRVRHLIVLPGGGAPEPDGPGSRDEGRQHRGPGLKTGGPATAEVSARSAPPPAALASAGAAHAAAATAEALPLPAMEPPRLKLSLRVISRTVSAPRAPGIPFILFASALVSAAILGLVVLNVMVDQSSFRLGQLDGQVIAQQTQLRQLDYAVSVGEAPGRIAALAARIGMVPATQVKALAPTATAVTPATTSPSAPAASAAPPASRGLSPGSTANVTHVTHP